MKTIRNLLCLSLAVVALNAQTATQLDVSKVKGAAQLGSDGKVLPSQLPPSSGGGSGASQTAQLLDWKFTRVSGTQLSFGESCLATSPCNVDIGGTVSQFSDGPYLINLSGNASGSICVYVAAPGQITVGIGTGLTGSNFTGSNSLTFVTGVNTCPQDATKLAKWDVATGAFNSTGSLYASYLSYKPSPSPGTGIQVVAGNRDTIQIDTGAVVRKFSCTGGPAAMLPSGATLGDICWDFNGAPNRYVCGNAGGCSLASDWRQF